MPYIEPEARERLDPAIDALAGQLEFYRRALAPYEDEKIREHGDLYPER